MNWGFPSIFLWDYQHIVRREWTPQRTFSVRDVWGAENVKKKEQHGDWVALPNIWEIAK